LAVTVVRGIAEGLPVLPQAAALVAALKAQPKHPAHALAVSVDFTGAFWPLQVLRLADQLIEEKESVAL
jgi:hypothetical protein